MAWTERYFSNAGSGAADGTSEANAWSFSTMLTSITAGQRGNFKENITRTTSTDIFTNSGTTALPMAIRGYKATIGDLENAGRTRGGHLVVTDFPMITYTTGTLTTRNFTILEHLYITSAAAGSTLATGTNNTVRRCQIENTHASSTSAVAYTPSGTTRSFDCDIHLTAGGSTARALVSGGGWLVNCLVTGGNGICAALSSAAVMEGCTFRDAVAGITAASGTTLSRCVFRNISGIYLSNTGGPIHASNCVAWGSGGSSQWYDSAGSVRNNGQFNNFVGNMGAADGNPGDWLDLYKVALTADPFVSSTDLTLNNTSGGGALVRGLGYPAYIDGGAWQHQDVRPPYAFAG